MDIRTNFFETLNGRKPGFFINQWNPYEVLIDPLLSYCFPEEPGKTIVDGWGVTQRWDIGEAGWMPIINEQTKALPDIEEWESTVKCPDINHINLDWSSALAEKERIHAEGKLVMSMMSQGLFEQSHAMMGFEDTLVNLLAEPESMHEWIEFLTQYNLDYAKILVENLHPDIVCLYDDFGSKTNLFMSRDIWCEFFKPGYRKIYEYLHANDVIVMQHSDCHCELIAADLEEIGADIWQGVIPQNNIKKIQQKTHKMLLMGGIDSPLIDVKDWNEDNIRAEVARACREYVSGGRFIPSMTYGGAESMFPGVYEIVTDEIEKQSKLFFK